MSLIVEKTSLNKVKKDWMRLTAGYNNLHPCQDYDMVKLTNSHYLFFKIAAREFPFFLIVKEDNKIVLIAPLCRRFSLKGISYVSFGTCPTYASQDFIYDKDLSVEKLAEYIKAVIKWCGKVSLHYLMESSKTCKALGLLGFTPENEMTGVSIQMPKGYETYFSSLSKNARQNIRTAYNRIAKDEMKFEVEYHIGGLNPQLYREVMDVYIARRRSRYRSTSKLHVWFAKYYHYNAVALQKFKNSIYVVIKINDKVASFWGGFISNKTVMVPRLAINDEFRRYSPGILLINETMKLFENKLSLTELDLSKGKDEYKLVMGGDEYLYLKYLDISMQG